MYELKSLRLDGSDCLTSEKKLKRVLKALSDNQIDVTDSNLDYLYQNKLICAKLREKLEIFVIKKGLILQKNKDPILEDLYKKLKEDLLDFYDSNAKLKYSSLLKHLFAKHKYFNKSDHSELIRKEGVVSIKQIIDYFKQNFMIDQKEVEVFKKVHSY